MIKLLLHTVLLSACIGLATAISCYECNSVNNSMCLEPAEYDPETLQKYLQLTECTLGVLSHTPREFFCRKIVQTILHKGHDSEVRVSRGCGWVRARHACYTADNEDHLETVCQCFADGCNGASAGGAAVAAVLAGLLVNKYS